MYRVYDDPHLRIVPLSEALMTIATHSTSLFAPYAEEVFDSACSNIEGQCSSALSFECVQKQLGRFHSEYGLLVVESAVCEWDARYL